MEGMKTCCLAGVSLLLGYGIQDVCCVLPVQLPWEGNIMALAFTSILLVSVFLETCHGKLSRARWLLSRWGLTLCEGSCSD